nr:tail fiber assembly protein [Raoultella planticola]
MMTFKMSEINQVVVIYDVDPDTGELLGSQEINIPPHTGLPAYTTPKSPPDLTPGMVPVFDLVSGSWSLIEDHRGQIVFSTASGEPVEISELGELPEGVTTKVPVDSYQKWDGVNWVDDTEAKEGANKQVISSQADSLIKISRIWADFFPANTSNQPI